MSEIPKGQLSRAGIVGSTAIKLGARELSRRTLKPFRTADSNQTGSVEFDEKSAQLLFDALTKLKGTAVKLAQMLSMEADILPDRVQKELAKSCHQVPPLNRVLVNKVVAEAFDQTPAQLFASFDTTAFAAASLGQVHKATLPADAPGESSAVNRTISNDTRVAVKIQYPGIHVAMESDIRLLRKVAVALPNRKIVEQSINEVHQRLREELDYSLEAAHTQWFRDNLKIEGVEVPEVYEPWCSERVLTTKLLDGQHLGEWLAANPSQSIRNRAGQCLYDLFVHSVRELKCLHADPNPGNFLFRNDGTVGLIDFGCVKTFSSPFVTNLPLLLNALKAGDRQAVFSSYANLGMTFDATDEGMFDRVLKPFGQWLSLPFEDEFFDFGVHSDYTSSGRDLIHRLAKLSNVDTIAEEFIFFDRTVYGLCKIFEQMQAKIRMRHHWQ